MKKILILVLLLAICGCSTKKQFVKLGEKIDSAEFRAGVADDGIVYLAKQQVKIEKTIEDIKGDLEVLKGKMPGVEKKYNYIVKEGDCLWKIALEIYRNAYRWIEIYSENSKQIKNPNLIFPGQTLLIPIQDK